MEISAIWGGVWRLMANAIKNFICFEDFPDTLLIHATPLCMLEIPNYNELSSPSSSTNFQFPSWQMSQDIHAEYCYQDQKYKKRKCRLVYSSGGRDRCVVGRRKTKWGHWEAGAVVPKYPFTLSMGHLS